MAHDVPLRDYVDALFERLLSEMKQALADNNRNVDRAAGLMDRRLDDMNDFRAQVEADRPNYITVARYDEKHADLERRLAKIEAWQANIMGRVVGIAVLGSVFIAAVAAFITHLLS